MLYLIAGISFVAFTAILLIGRFWAPIKKFLSKLLLKMQAHSETVFIVGTCIASILAILCVVLALSKGSSTPLFIFFCILLLIVIAGILYNALKNKPADTVCNGIGGCGSCR